MPRTGTQQWVAVEQLEVAGQLLDAVDLAAPLDLDGNGPPVAVAAHQVDRADGGGVLPPHETEAVGQRRGVLGEQLLEVLLDAVLLQAGVDAEVVAGVVDDLLDQDPQAVTGLGFDRPLDLPVLGGALPDGARRAHPVQRLVGAAVGVHQHRAVGLEHQHPGGHRQVRGQPPGVVDLTAGHDESHERRIYLPCWRGGTGAGESHRGRSRGHRADLCRPAGRGRVTGSTYSPGTCRVETTSVVAAALWYPYNALPQDRVTAWAASVLRRFRRPCGRRRPARTPVSG